MGYAQLIFEVKLMHTFVYWSGYLNSHMTQRDAQTHTTSMRARHCDTITKHVAYWRAYTWNRRYFTGSCCPHQWIIFHLANFSFSVWIHTVVAFAYFNRFKTMTLFVLVHCGNRNNNNKTLNTAHVLCGRCTYSCATNRINSDFVSFIKL